MNARRVALGAAGMLVAGSMITLHDSALVAGRPLGTLIAFAAGAVLVAASLRSCPRFDRLLVLAAAACLGVHAVGLAIAPDPTSVLRVAAKEALALAVLIALLASRDRARLRRVLGWVAATFIAIHLVLLVAAWSPVGENLEGLFERGHEKLGWIPRFTGLSRNPTRLGLVMLACAGLARGLPTRRLRHATEGGALLVCATTLSFATLLAPLVLLGHTSRRTRIVQGVAVLGLALMPLYFTPTAVRVGGAPLYAREHSSTQGLRTVSIRLGALDATVRTTAYLELATGALRCFSDHPITGVGAENFAASCPVRATDTRGWAGPHRTHQQYLGLLAERGLLGAAAAVALLLALRRRWRLHPDPVRRAALYALLACGLSKPILHLPLVVLLVATALRRRAPPRSASRPSCPSAMTGEACSSDDDCCEGAAPCTPRTCARA